MKTHILKTVNPHFAYVADGRKTFEMRRCDRDYDIGDILHLKEWIGGDTNKFTGKSCLVKVTHILNHNAFELLPADYIIMSIKLI